MNWNERYAMNKYPNCLFCGGPSHLLRLVQSSKKIDPDSTFGEAVPVTADNERPDSAIDIPFSAWRFHQSECSDEQCHKDCPIQKMLDEGDELLRQYPTLDDARRLVGNPRYVRPKKREFESPKVHPLLQSLSTLTSSNDNVNLRRRSFNNPTGTLVRGLHQNYFISRVIRDPKTGELVPDPETDIANCEHGGNEECRHGPFGEIRHAILRGEPICPCGKPIASDEPSTIWSTMRMSKERILGRQTRTFHRFTHNFFFAPDDENILGINGFPPRFRMEPFDLDSEDQIVGYDRLNEQYQKWQRSAADQWDNLSPWKGSGTSTDPGEVIDLEKFFTPINRKLVSTPFHKNCMDAVRKFCPGAEDRRESDFTQGVGGGREFRPIATASWNERYAAETALRMKARDIVQQFKPDMDLSTIESLPKGHTLTDAWNSTNKNLRATHELSGKHGDTILDNIKSNNMHDPISVYRGDTSGYAGIKGMVTDGHHRLTTALYINPDCEFTVRDDPFYAAFEEAHKETPCTGKADCPNCSNLEQPHY